MGARDGGSNPLTRALARALADLAGGGVDVFLDVTARAGSNYRKKEQAAPRRPAEWWNSPEPRSRSGRRSGGRWARGA